MIDIASEMLERTIAAIILVELRRSGAEVGGVFGDWALGGLVEAVGVGGSDF